MQPRRTSGRTSRQKSSLFASPAASKRPPPPALAAPVYGLEEILGPKWEHWAREFLRGTTTAQAGPRPRMLEPKNGGGMAGPQKDRRGGCQLQALTLEKMQYKPWILLLVFALSAGHGARPTPSVENVCTSCSVARTRPQELKHCA